jgi:hypothetical protein
MFELINISHLVKLEQNIIMISDENKKIYNYESKAGTSFHF